MVVYQYTITYHTSVDDAENGVNPLENAYTVVDQVDLFVRVQDNVTGCYISNIDFTLTVEPKPLLLHINQSLYVTKIWWFHNYRYFYYDRRYNERS